MNYRFDNIQINEAQPFANCKLGRERYADLLTGIVETLNGGCVLALNGEWGVGKTTFIRMWGQHLQNNGFRTIYFNAWKTDFISDPLIALIGELKELSVRYKLEGKFTDLITATLKVIASAFPAILKAFFKYRLGEEAVNAIEEATKGGIDCVKEKIDSYKEDCNSIEAFRSALESYVESISSDKPFVFFIDELDRCNPHYAVKVLERIKHLFSVPRIVFVLSVDKEQLSNSICGYYGSERINATEYLRRFIDLEYSLPQPDYKSYIKYLLEKLDFVQFFFRNGETYDKREEMDYFSEIATLMFSSKNLSLRQMEKIMTHARLALQTFSKKQTTYPELIILFLYLKHFESGIYTKILRREYSIQNLVDALEEKLPSKFFSAKDMYNTTSLYRAMQSFAAFLSVYNINAGWSEDEVLYDNSDTEHPRLNFRVTKFEEKALVNALNFYRNGGTLRNLPSMKCIIEHIELLSELQPFDDTL